VKGNNVIVRNLTVTNTVKNGITVYGPTDVSPVIGATGVILDNLTLKNNAAAGLIVNGSTVTLTGTYTSSGNAWGSINLGIGSSMTSTPSLTIDGATVNIAESNPIWADYAGASENSFTAVGWYCRDHIVSNGGASSYVFAKGSGTMNELQTFTATALNWVEDRYSPAKWENLSNFNGRSNVIHSVVDASTAAAMRSGGQNTNFYNTQGKRITFTSSPDMELSVEIFVSADMLQANSKPYYLSAWLATTSDANVAPIIAVANAVNEDDGRNYTAGAMTPHWMVWNEMSGTNPWSIAPVAVTAGWHKVSFKRSSANSQYVNYFIDDTPCGSYDMDTDSGLTFDAFILQNYNYTSVEASAPTIASSWASYSFDAYFANAQVQEP